jgi:hypothetical protein
MTRREIIVRRIVLFGGLVALPAISAAATAAFMTGREKWGLIALVALANWYTAIGCFAALHWSMRKIHKLNAPVDAMITRLTSENAALGAATARLEAAIASFEDGHGEFDDERFLALSDDKMLSLLAMITAVHSREEPDEDAANMMYRSLLLESGMFSEMDSLATLNASRTLIVRLVTALAKGRGESFDATWQREAARMSMIINERRTQ